jgi:2-phospho-L-lactate guanylyltransferase
VLLVPVKSTADAKSRLGLALEERLALRRAFAQDAVTAARQCALAEVYVVGDAAGLDAPALPDEGRGDLNQALRRAAERVARPDTGTAVMLADLPCLCADELAATLSAARDAGARCFVADAAGTGTTLLTAPPGAPLDPHFGTDSARRHRTSGALELELAVPTLRRDVDTPDDLTAARALGVGRHTAVLLDGLATGRRGDAERR